MAIHTHPRTALLAMACATLLAIGGCSKSQPERTTGQKVDAAISSIEKKADVAGVEIQQGLERAKESASKGMERASDTARDAGITTQITADLARDPDLSALKIDVTTVAGKVVLQGTAPTEAARERAGSRAQAVSGVTSVDNLLRVGG